MGNFLETTLPKIATPVHRLGLAASYWPGKAAVHKALDEGLNYFFLFGFDRQMVKVLREALPRERERFSHPSRNRQLARARCPLNLAVFGVLEDDLESFSHCISLNDS